MSQIDTNIIFVDVFQGGKAKTKKKKIESLTFLIGLQC